jgi:Kef-type K+ transport system membrane component KefB
MQDAILLIGFGVLFLAGLALDSVGRHIHVPRVTLLILLGAVVGPPVLDWLPRGMVEADDVVAPTALTMVAFLLGGALHRRKLAAHGREILMISITVVAVSVIVVAGGLMLAGVSAAFAFLLGGISAATAPAATLDVIRQSGKTGRFVDNLRGIVAIDDAWGLIVFSLVLTVAGVLAGNGHSNALADGIIEAGGSILLGLAIGLPGAFLTGRIKPGEPTLIEALGLVFLCAGLALWFELSFLLAGMTAGVTIVNLARHHDRPFHEIERIEWPFVLVFRAATSGLVGGKNSSLGEMVQPSAQGDQGAPGGFATTSDAYRAFVEANNLRAVIREKMEALDEHRITLQEAGSSIRKAFEAAHWPDDIAEDIKAAYAEMSEARGSGGTFRRRPLVGHRRGPARRQLRRPAGDLPERRRRQGAAGRLPPLLRLALHRPGDHLSQPQGLRPRGGGAVDRRAADGALRPVGSGVMFSIDTETGFDKFVLITGAWGLGENVVQGAVDPDEFQVFKPFLDNPACRPSSPATSARKRSR